MRKIIGFIIAQPLLTALLIAASLAVGRVAYLSAKLDRAERQLVEVQVDAMNQVAMNDSVQSYLRDSLTRVTSKLVVQVKPEADTASAATVVAHVEEREGHFVPLEAAPTDTTEQEYEFPFVLYPFHGVSKVSVWPAEGRARAHIVVGLAPARFRAAVTCGPAQPPAGLRFARYSLQGPPWLLIDSVQVQQDPVVCNAPVLMSARKTAPTFGWVAPLSAAVGATVAGVRGRNPWHGLGIGAGIGLVLTWGVRQVVK